MRSKLINNNYIEMTIIMKPIDLPTSFYVAKAAWMGVGSQSNLPQKGQWHKWINELFVFFRNSSKAFLNEINSIFSKHLSLNFATKGL
ncbi:hypothetical protein N9L92_05690 [Saprospiraceae bacterium]|nr:hypothetical protein [Saprospiraceae bacterium]